MRKRDDEINVLSDNLVLRCSFHSGSELGIMSNEGFFSPEEKHPVDIPFIIRKHQRTTASSFMNEQ